MRNLFHQTLGLILGLVIGLLTATSALSIFMLWFTTIDSKKSPRKNFTGYKSSEPESTEKLEKDKAGLHSRSVWDDRIEYILSTQAEAEEVIKYTRKLLATNGYVTVHDLATLVGVESGYPETKYGWKSLTAAQIRRVPEGYLIWLPTPEQL